MNAEAMFGLAEVPTAHPLAIYAASADERLRLDHVATALGNRGHRRIVRAVCRQRDMNTVGNIAALRQAIEGMARVEVDEEDEAALAAATRR